MNEPGPLPGGGAVGAALATAHAIEDAGRRADALRALAPHLAKSVACQRLTAAQAWVRTIAVLSRRPRPELLLDLTALKPFILALAGEEAPQVAQGLFEAIQDVSRWWP